MPERNLSTKLVAIAKRHWEEERFDLSYVYANEALLLDREDDEAKELQRSAGCKLMPCSSRHVREQRVELLHQKALLAMGRAGAEQEVIDYCTRALQWDITAGVLSTRAEAYIQLQRWELAYVDASEALELAGADIRRLLQIMQKTALERMRGFKHCFREINAQMVAESQQQQYGFVYEGYSPSMWPKGLRLRKVHVQERQGFVEVFNADGVKLIPAFMVRYLDKFLNTHVIGAVEKLTYNVPTLMEEHVAPLRKVLAERLTTINTMSVHFIAHFEQLSPKTLRELFDRPLVRGRLVSLFDLHLPPGIEPAEFLRLGVISECIELGISIYPYGWGPGGNWTAVFRAADYPQFEAASLLAHLLTDGHGGADGWVKRMSITDLYIRGGAPKLVDVIREDFTTASSRSKYVANVPCFSIRTMEQAKALEEAIGEQKVSNSLGEWLYVWLMHSKNVIHEGCLELHVVRGEKGCVRNESEEEKKC